MKKLFILTTLVLELTTAFGRNGGDSFKEGDKFVSLGYGYGMSYIFDAYSDYGNFSSSRFGPITGKFEYAITDKIGIGGSVNYFHSTCSWNYDDLGLFGWDTFGWDVTRASLIGRINYHFITKEEMDLYAGAGFGIQEWKWKYEFSGAAGNTLIAPSFGFMQMEAGVGFRYYLIPNLAIYTEAGFGMAYIQAGTTFKF